MKRLEDQFFTPDNRIANIKNGDLKCYVTRAVINKIDLSRSVLMSTWYSSGINASYENSAVHTSITGIDEIKKLRDICFDVRNGTYRVLGYDASNNTYKIDANPQTWIDEKFIVITNRKYSIRDQIKFAKNCNAYDGICKFKNLSDKTIIEHIATFPSCLKSVNSLPENVINKLLLDDRFIRVEMYYNKLINNFIKNQLLINKWIRYGDHIRNNT